MNISDNDFNAFFLQRPEQVWFGLFCCRGREDGNAMEGRLRRKQRGRNGYANGSSGPEHEDVSGLTHLLVSVLKLLDFVSLPSSLFPLKY